MEISPGGSYYIGILPDGCRLCLEGAKAVLFLGGDCFSPEHCRWYCPISQERRRPTAVFIDEIPVKDYKTIKEEIEMIQGLGLSFTGGDPLYSSKKAQLVSKYAKKLKRDFGTEFHLHLYTSGLSFNKDIASELYSAGLDEIRFHPPPGHFQTLLPAFDFDWSVGAEVPGIPSQNQKEYIISLADFLRDHGGQFLNINEFEINQMNYDTLKLKGFSLLEETLAAVEGSREFYLDLLSSLAKGSLNIHFCPVSLKDSYQYRKRFFRRAETIHAPYEFITPDGLLYYLEIAGSLPLLKEFRVFLENEADVPTEMIGLIVEKEVLRVPYYFGENKEFLELLNNFGFKDVGFVESTPFSETYRDVCEYIPLDF